MRDIQERLLTPDGHGNRKGIKLCYVTPEKVNHPWHLTALSADGSISQIVKSKTFSSVRVKSPFSQDQADVSVYSCLAR